MKVIINGDDLAYSQESNSEVFKLMKMRKISSATIMANGTCFEEAVIGSRKNYEDCSFGIHLNLTEFMPITNNQIMYDSGLVDGYGFSGKIRKIKLDKYLKEAIYLELEQQIIKLLDNGIKISHIDSHHHIHTIPKLFFIIKKLQKKFNIKKVRRSMNYYNKFYRVSFGKKLGKHLWNGMMNYYFKTIMTDYFTFAKFFITDIHNCVFRNDFTIELMCHPGSEAHGEETELLYTDWLKKYDIELISYNDL